ncbi:PQQ-binding-like beta-propeller repeat protein [Rubripirellula tenax]|nr:PQQ-binding-like beta-propeller repeat protein [Rubripirellula tenax]
MKLRNCLFVACFCSLISPSIGTAGDRDWPQWRGPQRDGHAAAQPLLESWPDGGPAQIWQASGLGRGYSTAAVVDQRIYTLGSDEAGCFAVCLNAADGGEVWRTTFSRASNGDDYNQGWGGGPRSTPTVVGNHIYVLSDVGVAAAIDRDSGDVTWKVDVVESYGGKVPTWGYSESLLVDGDRVVVTPGESNFMVGLNCSSGEKVWTSQGVNAPAQYVSPIKATVAETTFYVTASKPGLFAFDTTSGGKVFSDASTGNNVAVIPTPILQGDELYHTSDYGSGNTLIKLSGNGGGKIATESIYHLADKTMQNHHGGVVLVDGVIYGFTKANGGTWMAQDMASGETLWEEKIRPNRSGSIAFADGRLYCYNDKDGSVYLVKPSRTGWESSGRLELPRQTDLPRDKGAIWAHPIIADGMLIIRDQDLMFAYDISRK